MKIYGTFGGVGLFALSLTASALSLGQSQGQVVLGAPLDLVFQLQTDAGNDVAASCVVAELILGDRHIDSGRVRVTPASAKSVRVTSSVTVDEPVVVVELSAGCVGRIARQYTFFADPPQAVSRDAMLLDIAQLGALPTVTAAASPAVRTTSRASEAEPLASPVASPAPPPPPKPKPKPKSRPKPKPKPVAPPPQTVDPAPVAPAAAAPAVPPAAPPAPVAEASRLRMEPLEHWSGASGNTPAGAGAALTSAAPAGTAGSTTAAAAAAAAAAPAESAEQRVLALEAQMQALKDREASQSASIAQMRSEIAALHERGQSNAWTLPLLAALAIALLVLGWLLLRLRSLAQAPQRSWMHSVDASLRESDGAHPAAGTGSALVPAPAPAREFVSTEPLMAPGIELFPVTGAEGVGDGAERGAAALPIAQAGVSEPRARTMVLPEAFFDVRQQAEFFISVGEYEQAIALMREHIARHPDSSPLAYLELLGLFYQLSRRNAFDALREQFAQYFTAEVPDMPQFAQRGRSLEHYPALLERIEALWSTDHVVELLESQLFRRAGDAQRFDLEAYDDLLLLLSVAHTTSTDARGKAVATAVSTAAVSTAAAPAMVDAPWATLERGGTPLPQVSVPEGSNAFALETPSHFDVPEVPFARSQPLLRETGAVDAALPLLDIDLSGIDSSRPAAQPSVEALSFDATEFPQRAIIGSGVETVASIDADELMRTLSAADMTLTPQEQEESDGLFLSEKKDREK